MPPLLQHPHGENPPIRSICKQMRKETRDAQVRYTAFHTKFYLSLWTKIKSRKLQPFEFQAIRSVIITEAVYAY
jgi:hypothetical protein